MFGGSRTVWCSQPFYAPVVYFFKWVHKRVCLYSKLLGYFILWADFLRGEHFIKVSYFH